MRPANSNALPPKRVDPNAIPHCNVCSPIAKRRQGGGREWLEYTFLPPCWDCARAKRLRGCSGRSASIEQANEVRRVFGLGAQVLLFDFGSEVRCMPAQGANGVLEEGKAKQ